jgi:hypothetical protein
MPSQTGERYIAQGNKKGSSAFFSAEIYLILKDDRCGTDEILILRSNLRDGQQSEDIKNLRLIK